MKRTYASYTFTFNDESDKLVGFDVNLGHAAATLNDNLSFLDFKKHQPNAKVKVAASEPANAPSGILVRKNQTTLVDVINKAPDEIKADGTYKTISLRYFGQDISQ